jgi:hypothetical protein
MAKAASGLGPRAAEINLERTGGNALPTPTRGPLAGSNPAHNGSQMDYRRNIASSMTLWIMPPTAIGEQGGYGMK